MTSAFAAVITIVIFYVPIVIAAFYALHRNNAVYDEKIRVLNEIRRLAEIDRHSNRDPQWRYDAFNEIEYNRMMWREFWRPVKSFYKGHRCLRES